MKSIVCMTIALLGFLTPVFAQKSEVFTSAQGAIQGYDPVAYFKESKPVKGSEQFTYSWKGANWHFANPENLAAFKANPQKFAPQYGGYCAYGTAQGHKAPTDPQAWSIVGNKLYLNYDKDVQSKWKKDQPGYIKKADQNWPTVSQQD